MKTEFKQIIEDVNSLIEFLKSENINPSLKSPFENDYLLATQFVDNYYKDKSNYNDCDGRASLGGLHEMYKWVWSIKDLESFKAIVPHLKMLSESAIRINDITQFINPVTGKQDDKTNKLIETIVAMCAIKIGTNVEIDDPVKSSNGTNPDIMFDYNEKRIAIACKTLSSRKIDTIRDNFESAAKQIEKSKCDFGYVAINTMNILPHEQIKNVTYYDVGIPLYILRNDLTELYDEVKLNLESILKSSPKVKPLILSFIHSSTRVIEPPLSNQVLSTSIKCTDVYQLTEYETYDNDLEILNFVNDFIHNKL